MRIRSIHFEYKRLELNKLNHIAIIMDGNGRWANLKEKKRIFGHEKGADTVRNITIHASKLGLPYLTLYAFSTENWKRPKIEVDFLMNLLSKYLKNELKTYLENNVRFNIIGDISKFSTSLQDIIIQTVKSTENCNGLIQTLAINYGSKDEIARAVNQLIKNGKKNVTITDIESALDTKNMPPVDILIRTGGEKRLSNFLLWQCAYSEFFFTDTLWPDFTPKEFDKIIEEYRHIKRKFGGI